MIHSLKIPHQLLETLMDELNSTSSSVNYNSFHSNNNNNISHGNNNRGGNESGSGSGSGVFVGAFLHKQSNAIHEFGFHANNSNNSTHEGVGEEGLLHEENSAASSHLDFHDMYDVGTFAQIHLITPLPSTSNTTNASNASNTSNTNSSNSKSNRYGNGVQLLVMGHRRIRKLCATNSHHSHTGFSDESVHPPLSVLVQHLKDHPYDKTDEVMKATAMEVVATIKVN